MKIFATAGFAVGLALTGTTAQGAPTGSITVNNTCAVEVLQLCAGKTDAALRQCIAASGPNLSSACKQALADANLKVKEIKPGTVQ